MTQPVQSGTWLRNPRSIPTAEDLTSPHSAVDASRLACVDMLRGAAMVLMALDHTRSFFTSARFAPEDLAYTSGPIFFTRWVTHFCAPVFFLLAGTGAYLSLSRGKSLPEISRFFWTRGLWLVFLNLTVIAFVWTFLLGFLFSDVLWSLGWSMVAMALLMRLPVALIAAFGTAVIVTHNLLDRVNPAAFGKFMGLWLLLYGRGSFWIGPGKLRFFVLWPLLPWVGVMAIGYALGALLGKRDWRKIVFSIGAATTTAFFFLRFFNLYGNGYQSLFGVAAGPWRVEPTVTLTIVSFFDTLKYPASLQFLLMTLGPALMVLAWLGKINTRFWLAKFLTVFGRVPLFYYVVHLYVIHTLAVYTAMIFKQNAAWLSYGGPMLEFPPHGYGHGLLFIYGMWSGVVLLMYPLSKAFVKLKQKHHDWWSLRYL